MKQYFSEKQQDGSVTIYASYGGNKELVQSGVRPCNARRMIDRLYVEDEERAGFVLRDEGVNVPVYGRNDLGLTLEERAIVSQARRILSKAVNRGDAFHKPEDVGSYLSLRLAGLECEIMGAVFLDTRHRLLKVEELFRGTLDGASIFPREVVREALAAGAAAVVLYHNHPSGVTEPSRADVRLTGRISSALELVDIRVLDHLVIAGGEWVSLAERGLL